MASSIHKGEEKDSCNDGVFYGNQCLSKWKGKRGFPYDTIMLGVHTALKEIHPDTITIIVPRHPQHGEQIALVSGYILVEALINLLSDAKLLEARQKAAKQAYHALSCGITENVWSLLDFHIFQIALAHQGQPKRTRTFQGMPQRKVHHKYQEEQQKLFPVLLLKAWKEEHDNLNGVRLHFCGLDEKFVAALTNT
ncbi:hypothetical protein RND71_035939 [Anisodus tanguticus]|uniref:Uncharacterized protein n=1 Tax=Anisodus tanguticus TaxID=243964 RepID=A0AAE1R655_9SOLA|nr:hypothetical protein RND71_035939 [Anisodus tanguticus]